MIGERSSSCCSLDSLDPLADLGRLTAGFRNLLIRQIDIELAPLDLTAAQYGIIINIANGNATTLVELCNKMDYDRGAMSRLLNRLEKKELIERKKCPDDARSSRLVLTAKGQAFFPELTPKIRAIYQRAMTGFSDEEQHVFTTLLYRAAMNLQAP